MICSIQNCKKVSRSNTWCQMHYTRWKRHGDTGINLRSGGYCSVDNCSRKMYAKKLCKLHYQRWQNNGTTDITSNHAYESTTGQFIRTRQIWTPEDYNNGHTNNKGRFMVYMPDHPCAYASGYILRSHAVWWITTGEIVEYGYNLHHKNHIKTDDVIGNLELIEHAEHIRQHMKKLI